MPKKKDKQRRHQIKKAQSVKKHKPKDKKAPSNTSIHDDEDYYDDDYEDMAYPSDIMRIIDEKSEYDHKIVENGYRIIGPAQAMLDYAKPLIDKCETQEDMNKALKFAQLCWTMAVMEDIELRQVENARKEIKKLKYPDEDKLVDEMLERFKLMFPQVGKVQSFYIKERVIDIEEFEPFDESTIKISDEVIPITEKEIELAKKLPRMIDIEGAELIDFKNDLYDHFFEWCLAKGVPEDIAMYLPNIVDSFLDFLMNYYYEPFSRRMPIAAIENFMRIHYIRKNWAPASEKVFMPTALKLFIRYIDEKGIMSNMRFLMRIIEYEQKIFLKNLRLYIDPSLEGKI